MTFQVRVHPEAIKFLRKLDQRTRKKIEENLRLLEEDPYRGRPKADIKRLKGIKGRQDLFRLRIGDFRVIYAVEEETVWITDIFRRGEGYKGI